MLKNIKMFCYFITICDFHMLLFGIYFNIFIYVNLIFSVFLKHSEIDSSTYVLGFIVLYFLAALHQQKYW
jgi:hypothetical protein